MTVEEYKQELLAQNPPVTEPELSEALNEYTENYLAEEKAKRDREESLNEEVKVGLGFYIKTILKVIEVQVLLVLQR